MFEYLTLKKWWPQVGLVGKELLVRKKSKMRNRYNQVSYLTQDNT